MIYCFTPFYSNFEMSEMRIVSVRPDYVKLAGSPCFKSQSAYLTPQETSNIYGNRGSIASGKKLIFKTLYSAVCLFGAVRLEKDSRIYTGLIAISQRATPWAIKTTSVWKSLKEPIKLCRKFFNYNTHIQRSYEAISHETHEAIPTHLIDQQFGRVCTKQCPLIYT